MKRRSLKRNRLNKINAVDVIIAVVMGIWGLIILYPFYNTLLISLVSQSTYLQTPFMLYPKGITLDSYRYVFQSGALLSGFRVTLILVTVGTAYNMFLTVTLAYALTRPFPGNKFVHYMVLFTMYFSGGLIPTYLVVQKLGLLNSIASMILPAGVSVSYMLIIMRFFDDVPKELEESAALDGCTEIGVLIRIVLPISLPMLATFALYYGVERWNEWYNGMLYIKSVSKLPLQTVLRNIIQDAETETHGVDSIRTQVHTDGVKMAAIFVTMTPIMCLYPFLQKYFVGGLTAGAVKS